MRKTQQEKMTDELKAPEAGRPPQKGGPQKEAAGQGAAPKVGGSLSPVRPREWKTSDLVQQVRSAYVAEGHRASRDPEAVCLCQA